jgi:beta-glucosidase
MPGPTRWRTPTHLDLLIGARKVKSSTVDERVKGVLDFVQQTTRRLPEIVFGKDEERTLDNKEHQAVARRAATGAIVLLKNDRAVLPLGPELQRIALIGPSVKARVLTGGGSAKLGASYCVTPWEGLTQAAPKSLKIDFALGAIGEPVRALFSTI